MVATTPLPAMAALSCYPGSTAGISVTLNAGGAGTVTGDSSVGTDTINGGVNSIVGSNFNDTITLNSPGSNFQSFMTGNGGNDTFVFKPNFGHATIADYHSGDTIDIDHTRFSITDIPTILASAAMSGVNTVLTDNVGDTITFVNVLKTDLHASDFHLV